MRDLDPGRVMDFSTISIEHAEDVLVERLEYIRHPDDAEIRDIYFNDAVASLLALEDRKHLVTPAMVKEAADIFYERDCLTQFATLVDHVKAVPALIGAISQDKANAVILKLNTMLSIVYGRHYGPAVSSP